MIVAAYAGCGESTFASRNPFAVDLYSMPRRWILPADSPEERESLKTTPYFLRNPAFPENYLADFFEAGARFDYV